MEAINIDNYKEHIGKKVEVEICCYEGGMMYPDENVLVGMNPDYFYFYSEEDETYWHWKAIDVAVVILGHYAKSGEMDGVHVNNKKLI